MKIEILYHDATFYVIQEGRVVREVYSAFASYDNEDLPVDLREALAEVLFGSED